MASHPAPCGKPSLAGTALRADALLGPSYGSMLMPILFWSFMVWNTIYKVSALPTLELSIRLCRLPKLFFVVLNYFDAFGRWKTWWRSLWRSIFRAMAGKDMTALRIRWQRASWHFGVFRIRGSSRHGVRKARKPWETARWKWQGQDREGGGSAVKRQPFRMVAIRFKRPSKRALLTMTKIPGFPAFIG